MRGAITTDPLDFKGMLEGCYEQVCACQFDTLDRALQRHSLPNSHRGARGSKQAFMD